MSPPSKAATVAVLFSIGEDVSAAGAFRAFAVVTYVEAVNYLGGRNGFGNFYAGSV